MPTLRCSIDDNFVLFVALSAAAAVLFTLFGTKLLGKDDKDLNKVMFRTALLVIASNAIVFYLLTRGRDTITTAPFFDNPAQ
jgi:hypothetical protein